MSNQINVCPYCSSRVECVSSKEFYGRDYGSHVYRCTSCDSYVGTHKGTKNPLGTLANKELRELRKQAHAVLDPMWRNHHMKRHSAYRRLSEYMGLDRGDTHIGMFNEEQCRRVIEGFRSYVLTKGKSIVSTFES